MPVYAYEKPRIELGSDDLSDCARWAVVRLFRTDEGLKDGSVEIEWDLGGETLARLHAGDGKLGKIENVKIGPSDEPTDSLPEITVPCIVHEIQSVFGEDAGVHAVLLFSGIKPPKANGELLDWP